jgi:hypothetical protein
VLTVDGDVLVTALKGAEAGDDIVLRAVGADLTELSIGGAVRDGAVPDR